MSFQNQLKFPDDMEYSEEAKDLICRLITSPEKRIGQNGIQDFVDHPFFQGTDWSTLRSNEAPYIPEVSSPTDTSNFDVDESDFRPNESVPPTSHSAFTGHHLPFIGFTFTKDRCVHAARNCFVSLLIIISHSHSLNQAFSNVIGDNSVCVI